jgi:basic membrane protein A
VAAEAGVYSIGYDSDTACDVAPDSCLTVPYWYWGPVYLQIAQEVQAGIFKPSDYYFETEGVGLLGFMPEQTPAAAIPAEVIPLVQETLAKMQAGEFSRFDIFTGPINNNEGVEVIPAGVKITQSDLEGIDEASAGVLGRPVCTFCMDWLAEGIIGEVPRCVYCSTTDSDE